MIFLTLFSSILVAQNVTTPLHIHPVPYYLDNTEQGTYIELMKRFGRENNHNFDISLASAERIERLLVRGTQNLCSLGFSLELAVTEGWPTAHIIESDSFNRIYTSILSRDQNPVVSVNQLDQKTLVVYHGNYQDALQRIPEGVDTSIVRAYTLDTLINTVLKGRVDAAFVTSPDILMSPDYQQSKAMLHLVELPNSDRKETLVCIDSAENRILINAFNQYINGLRQANELNTYTDYNPALTKPLGNQ